MRNKFAGRIAAAKIPRSDAGRRDEAVWLVCGALALALVSLAGRIVTVW